MSTAASEQRFNAATSRSSLSLVATQPMSSALAIRCTCASCAMSYYQSLVSGETPLCPA